MFNALQDIFHIKDCQLSTMWHLDDTNQNCLIMAAMSQWNLAKTSSILDVEENIQHLLYRS